MKKISALLIDDEISALNTLQGMLRQFFPQINVVATARSVSEALLMAQVHQPELVFLDVEMPPFGSGFDFVNMCQDCNFGVIFVTAHQEYAVKAINTIQPWGYLIKPINVTSLMTTVELALDKIEQELLKAPLYPATQSIVIPDARKGNIIIRIKNLIYCRADGTATDLFYEKQGEIHRTTASRTLKEIEEQLPPGVFCRSHHSFLVNLSWVERYEKTGRNGIIHLKNGASSPISVGKMEDFIHQFNAFLHLK